MSKGRKKKRPYHALFCDFKADIFAWLILHEQTHGARTFECEICKFIGKTKASVRKHQTRHKDPKYLCHECDYKTYDSANFKCHTTVRHGTEILNCEKCNFSTKLKQTLKEHEKKATVTCNAKDKQVNTPKINN